MTVTEAERMIREYYRISNPTEEQDFQFIEAISFVIEETKDPHAMLGLGGWYYDKRRFDLAAKYYEMAAEYKLTEAYACLGYIWYYGRTGEKDFDKAFKYYSLAADAGDLESAYKVADMYKNGYAVEKDYEKYKSIIEDLYLKIKDTDELFDPLPQIFIRLTRIRAEQGETENIIEAVNLYTYAKDFLAQRLRINPFFGDLNNMKWLIEELYNLVEFDKDNFDFYDMYYLLTSPCMIMFEFENKKYKVECVEEDGEYVINFDGKWYRTRDDFFKKATINNYRLTEIYDYLENFEVV
jgi:tetratricopeptide (TPR) repeat protein